MVIQSILLTSCERVFSQVRHQPDAIPRSLQSGAVLSLHRSVYAKTEAHLMLACTRGQSIEPLLQPHGLFCIVHTPGDPKNTTEKKKKKAGKAGFPALAERLLLIEGSLGLQGRRYQC